MSIEHVITQSISAGGETISKRLSFTGSSEVNVSESGSGGVTNLQVIGFALDVSALKDIYIVCTTAISLFFNDPSGGSPDKTLVLVADQPFQWNNLSLITNPWGSTDVDSLYITKAGSGAWTLTIKALLDATP